MTLKITGKLNHYILVLILIGCFVVRLYRLNNPVADWHSWRQADTAAVARNFAEHGFDLLYPKMNNISNVQSGLENPQGYFFAEFPLYNAVYSGLFVTMHIFSIEEWGRLVTDFTSVLTALFLYLLVRRHGTQTLALLAAGIYAFIPYDIYYGRVILPEPSMTMATMGSIYFFDLWINSESKTKNKHSKLHFNIHNAPLFLLAVLCTALALLLKPVAVFFLLPLISLAWQRFGTKSILRIDLWLFFLLSVVPLLWWRWWESHFPEGIPAYLWLFNSNHIRFRPAFFRWIFYERVTKLISGYAGMIFLIFGVIQMRRVKKDVLFFLSFPVGALLYVFIIATGNVQHDYYQIPIMPALAILMALGVIAFASFLRKIVPDIVVKATILAFFVIGFWFAWTQVKDYFNINNPSIIAAGQAVQRLTPKNAKIIANYNGDSSFLYQTDRQGWASYEKDLPIMIKMGAAYLVLANPTAQDMGFAKTYRIIAQSPQYILFDLRQAP